MRRLEVTRSGRRRRIKRTNNNFTSGNIGEEDSSCRDFLILLLFAVFDSVLDLEVGFNVVIFVFLIAGCWMLDAGCWMLDAGCKCCVV